MVRLKSCLSNFLFSKNVAYILLITGFLYFTRTNRQRAVVAPRYVDPRLRYGSGRPVPPGPIPPGVAPLPGGQRSPPSQPVASSVIQAPMVGPPPVVVHQEPRHVIGNPELGNPGNGIAATDEHVASGVQEGGVVRMSHDPRFATEQEHKQHSKNSKNIHFSSSHHSQVGLSHVISDDKHGAYVPHTSLTSGHGIRDPYYSMHVRETEMEKMKTPLPSTLPNYRNPCWVEQVPRGFSYFEHSLYYQYYKYYPKSQPHREWEKTFDSLDHLIQVRKKRTKDGKSWRLRCFPYFFLIGFTRAGTTDLWRSMSMLPEFVRGLIKEPKFWNKIRLHNYAAKLPNATLSDYLDLYDGVAEAIRGFSSRMPGGSYYHPGITADMDAQTIWKLPNWQHIKGNQERDAPKFTTADHLYALSPRAKLIVMIRDPMERAFSHYCYFKTRKRHATKAELADKFHHDMVKATTKMARCFKQRGPKSCAYSPPTYNALAMRSVTIGMYSVFINDWLKVFPRKQFLFIKSEEYFADRVKTIKEISHFLGIDDTIPDSALESIKEFRVMNPSKKTGMHHETRELLKEFYKPFNRKLPHLLRSEKFQWE